MSLVKTYNCEYFIISFLILILIVFGNEPHLVEIAKSAGVENGIFIQVNAIDVLVAVVAIENKAASISI